MGAWLRHGDHRADIHVLYFGEPADQFEQCLETLLTQPVNIWLGPGTHGSLGAARAEAFRHGTAPLVGFVDPDDWLRERDAYDLSFAAYDQPQVWATYTHMYAPRILQDGSLFYHLIRQPPCTPRTLCANIWCCMHLHLYRRDAITPVLDALADWPLYEEAALAAYCLQRGGLVQRVDDVPYYKRESNNVVPMSERAALYPPAWCETRLRDLLGVTPEPPTAPPPPARDPPWVREHHRRALRASTARRFRP